MISVSSRRRIWTLFCVQHSVDPLHRNDLLALEFLRKLFKQGYGYSALNTARSALSTIFDNPFLESRLSDPFYEERIQQ